MEPKPPSPEEIRLALRKRADAARAGATELQCEVAKAQGEKWEVAMIRVMQRTGDNPELTNAMNGFLSALTNAAAYGTSDQPLNAERQRLMKTFFEDAAERLQMLGR